MISDSLGDCGGMPGRDTFIELLRQNDLMVRMRRRKHYRTTYSEHNYRKYPNLVKGVIPTREKCRSELERIIQFYNSQRPHMSIGMQTPDEVHGQEGPQKRCWKTYRERREAKWCKPKQ
ncbi:integrase core domain-containing protein [Fibrobacter sp. UBA3629]|uniref:integrase core domain-containing protein n=1 Tax=Fibrobacter sp. UBA3629 TaxID=1946530 RepID=UPI0025B993D0|nr:integrase core domain-containing protein [Fibrobacter sp. UBA3629]